MLGEFLEQNCPDVSVQVVVKSQEDWPDYIDSVSLQILMENCKKYIVCALSEISKTQKVITVISDHFYRFVALMDSMKGTVHLCTLWRASKSAMAPTSSSMCDSATAAPTCRC